MSVQITFLGASGTVTGSKYLVEAEGKRVLVDCGMFQGEREWREKNWETPPVDLKKIDAVLLTHAHLDHTGLLPRYYSLGLRCPIYCSPATQELTRILLLDSAHLQEEEAEYRNKRGKSRHNPALPLYTKDDALGVNGLLQSVPSRLEHEILPGVSARWHRMGHILGACSIMLRMGNKLISFSGDVGRYGIPILLDPEPVELADLLLIESTYGDRLHPAAGVDEELARVINRTEGRGGLVIVPAFAVGRTQHLLYVLRELKEQKKISNIPVIVDSPMANDATGIYREYKDDYDQAMFDLLRKGREPFTAGAMHFVQNREESIALNAIDKPMIIISASGMLTGGRILHHLKNRISDPRNTVLLVGFQPAGGRGAWLKSGAKTMKLVGDEVPIRAEIAEISGMSAHGDRSELIRWAKSCTGKPNKVAVVHGEQAVSASFAATLKQELGWDSFLPKYLQKVELD